MKIASVRIENFRSFKDETIFFNDYTCLVGPNGAGKSTVLNALNVFFRMTEDVQTNLQQLEEEDFHCRKTDNPIKITVTFKNLSQEANKDFFHYVRQDQLVVTAVATFVQTEKKADVKQYGQRLGIPAFAPFFKAESDKKLVPELKQIYKELRQNREGLPAPGSKQAMIQALREYESARGDECDLIPSEDQFYGYSKGTNLLSSVCPRMI